MTSFLNGPLNVPSIGCVNTGDKFFLEFLVLFGFGMGFFNAIARRMKRSFPFSLHEGAMKKNDQTRFILVLRAYIFDQETNVNF